MFVLGNLVYALANVVDIALSIYMWIVIVSALISWVNPDPFNPIVRFLYGITEPLFNFVRRHLPLPQMGIDFSPLIVSACHSFSAAISRQNTFTDSVHVTLSSQAKN